MLAGEPNSQGEREPHSGGEGIMGGSLGDIDDNGRVRVERRI